MGEAFVVVSGHTSDRGQRGCVDGTVGCGNFVRRGIIGGDVTMGVASRACSRRGFDRVVRDGRLLIFTGASISRTRRHLLGIRGYNPAPSRCGEIVTEAAAGWLHGNHIHGSLREHARARARYK